ncbi:hypothetical protein [Candidatus Odyssella acanthamoebae]|uniref:Uncharacterized protein n=1 Tax=Candidatus Odyssella acanthamoebae TaxID=91604 RepID=A0A077AZJ0_9PROT|nr:hypothetical protein [Candidatus Paracaedibacter acanthamoebae]AIK97118.1 hypothetical protein ID47_10870 [Candidatus Paracaedibacter acanthamoebae]
MKSLLIVIGLKFTLSASVYAGPHYDNADTINPLGGIVQISEPPFKPLETDNQAYDGQNNFSSASREGTALSQEKREQLTRLYHGIMGSDFIFKQFDTERQARYMHDNFKYHQFNEDIAIEEIKEIIFAIKIHQNK